MVERYLKPVKLPSGRYIGKWSGHELEFTYAGDQVFCYTKIGVRGINIPATFRVDNGDVDQSSIEVINHSIRPYQLPDLMDAQMAVHAGDANPVDTFIFHHTPHGPSPLFRERLQGLVDFLMKG